MTIEELKDLADRFPNSASLEWTATGIMVHTKHSYDGVCQFPLTMPIGELPDWTKPDAKPRGPRGTLAHGYVRIEIDYGANHLAEIAYGKLKSKSWDIEQADNLLEITAPGADLYQWILTETDLLPTDFPALVKYKPQADQFRCRHCGLTMVVQESHCGALMRKVEN